MPLQRSTMSAPLPNTPQTSYFVSGSGSGNSDYHVFGDDEIDDDTYGSEVDPDSGGGYSSQSSYRR